MFSIYVLILIVCLYNVSANPSTKLVSVKEPKEDELMVQTVPSMKLHQFGNSYYYIGTSLVGDWYQAMQFCNFHDMELVSIETKEEDDFLRTTIINYIKTAGREYLFWTSGTILGNQYWTWMSTGKPMNYTHWAPNNPSNSNGNEKCVELIYYTNTQQVVMNDKVCSSLQHLICESKIPQTVAKMLANHNNCNLTLINVDAN